AEHSVRSYLHRGQTMLRAFWERSTRRFTRARQTIRKTIWHGRFRPNLETLGDRIVPAVTGTFIPSTGVLTVFGSGGADALPIGRDATGAILVNKSAVAVSDGSPTVANTHLIQVFGLSGDDTIALDESNGPLPAANFFGGAGNDTLTGGSGNDLLL